MREDSFLIWKLASLVAYIIHSIFWPKKPLRIEILPVSPQLSITINQVLKEPAYIKDLIPSLISYKALPPCGRITSSQGENS
jgi:hypothetical protein